MQPAAPSDKRVEFVFRVRHAGDGEHWVRSWTRCVVAPGQDYSFGMHMVVTEQGRTAQRARHERRRAHLVTERRPPDPAAA